MVSQRTYVWKLPKRFRTEGFVINFFKTSKNKFRRKGFIINFCRILQKRFYVEVFATTFLNVSSENFVLSLVTSLSFFSLLFLLLGLPSFCYPLYSSGFLNPFYPFISSTYCTSFTFFTLCAPMILFIPLHCLCILQVFYLLVPPLTLFTCFTSFISLPLRENQRSQES